MIKFTPIDNSQNPNCKFSLLLLLILILLLLFLFNILNFLNILEPFWRFTAGVVAGIISTILTHPLDVLRVRLTVLIFIVYRLRKYNNNYL